MNPDNRKRQTLVTLLGLGLGLLGPMACLPPSEESPDRHAQRQTLRDVQKLGTAMFSWFTDQVGAAAAGQKEFTNLESDYPPITYERLVELLVPEYIDAVPRRDGWGRFYEYYLNLEDLVGKHVMAIRSPGRDGRFSSGPYEKTTFAPGDYDEDIVWVDGMFVRSPRGIAPAPELSPEPDPNAAKSNDPPASRRPPRSDLEAQLITVEEIKQVGGAMMAWLTDMLGAGAAGQSAFRRPRTYDLFHYPTIAHEDLEAILVPDYLKRLPQKDAWGTPYDYFLDREHLLREDVMAIRSPGRDGMFSGTEYVAGAFPPNDFHEDLVWANGYWVRWPGQG